jgi:hypothetical protein
MAIASPAARTPGTIAHARAAADADPQLNELYDILIARYAGMRTAAGARTAAQLRACRSHYGIRSALSFERRTECPECGAIPGFVHPASCTANRYPELGTEYPEITAALEMVAYGESPADARQLIAQAEDTGRTVIGQYAAVSCDNEPWPGKRTPYCVTRTNPLTA